MASQVGDEEELPSILPQPSEDDNAEKSNGGGGAGVIPMELPYKFEEKREERQKEVEEEAAPPTGRSCLHHWRSVMVSEMTTARMVRRHQLPVAAGMVAHQSVAELRGGWQDPWPPLTK